MCDPRRIQELSAHWSKLFEIPEPEVKQACRLRDLDLDKKLLLASIPEPRQPSHRAIHLLNVLLTELPGPWPVFELITCHTRVYKYLPEYVKAGKDRDLSALLDSTSDLVKKTYNSFSEFLPDESRPALRTTRPGNYISHRGLKNYVDNLRLPVPSGTIPTVAIALPNSPLLAATCVAVTTYYTSAPINPAAGPEQFETDVQQSGASHILTTRGEYEKLEMRSWTEKSGISVFFVDWTDGDDIAVRSVNGQRLSGTDGYRRPNRADDIGLLLFTSGTSGTKKVVPLRLHSIISGIVFVIDSWGLTQPDVCLNMMPLFHVGGLVRNIFAPIFSGGSTVCCAAFDPNTFWDVVEVLQPTWYYASPSMHSVILGEAAARPQALKNNKIRLACNAAGGLLPSLACQLRDTFNCVVLPSYGMTECMPISTPPLDYKLNREGTSGVSTGPDMTILDWSDKHVSSGVVGRVCVRGEPVFPGYLRPDGTFDKASFNPDGWFDTGDLGYMDDDGYLYITGRSKEVINRGGELISPFEVENAILSAAMSSDTPISGRVSQVLAFAATHDVLQEVVAVVLVTPRDVPRVDLKALHSALRSSLQQVKWPALITFMDDLPKKNNKVLRIKLGQRLGLPEINDDMTSLERHWEAKCPQPDTDLSVGIPSQPCRIDYEGLSGVLDGIVPSDMRYHFRQDINPGHFTLFVAPSRSGMGSPPSGLAEEIKSAMARSVHNYMLPDQIYMMPCPFPRDESGVIDEIKLRRDLHQLQGVTMSKFDSTTQGRVTKVFAEILSCHPDEISPNADFFSLGGDSLRAGRLVSLLRTNFNVSISISLIFNQGTVEAIAAHIDEVSKPGTEGIPDNVIGCSETRSSRNPLVMLIHLIPLVVLYPMRRALQWTAFIVCLSYTQTWPTTYSIAGRLFNLTISIMFGRVFVRCIAPWVGILAKWVIIGRYREGLYPMWGSYHTRWWLVQKIVSLCGKGFFSANDTTKSIYLRLMGARIGKGVKLAGASVGEWDLLDIRDGAVLTRCVCRPFAAEGNTSMYLGRIVIGENCFVGVSSIVSAGSEIPAGTCIGHNSSSWETEDADEVNRDLSPGAAAKPHWLLTCLLTAPLGIIAWLITLIPWLAGLVGMVLERPLGRASPLRDILNWFTDPKRVAFHYLALVLKTLFAPFFLFGFVLLVKAILDACFGQLKPGTQSSLGTTGVWRASLIKTLFPTSRLHDVTGMFGQHYEATSVAIRLLGGKIGKRVYWPGTGPSIGDYHLLDIGNDVVFGSRSHLMTSDAYGSDEIKIRDRAMIADRVCLLPGVEIGERATMGSGAMTRRNKAYPADSTFVGNKGGDAVCLSTGVPKPTSEEPSTSRMEQNVSEETLTEANVERRKKERPQFRRMASDETLAERGYATNRKVGSTQAASDQKKASGSSTQDSLSPFGRAFYLRLAPYRVMGPFAIFFYSSFITVLTAFYWNVPNISAIQIVNVIFKDHLPTNTDRWTNVAYLYLLMSVIMAILTTAQAVLALGIVIASKWILLGRRKPGNYDWDKSPYCQRWQLFLCIERLRRHCYRGHGVLGMLTGTHWIVLYFQALGADIGNDCALFANGRPSLMFTEPDLIKLGDRVTIDDASVVAHINTRGTFDLNRLEIGNRCVLRSGSRLLSGANMKDDSCLLEHTLIMGGDVVEEKWTMQGWPAERYTGMRAHGTKPMRLASDNV